MSVQESGCFVTDTVLNIFEERPRERPLKGQWSGLNQEVRLSGPDGHPKARWSGSEAFTKASFCGPKDRGPEVPLDE